MVRQTPAARLSSVTWVTLFTLLVCPLISPLAHADILPSDAAQYAATAKTVDGDVSVLRDFEKWVILPGDQIQVKETIVTGLDGHALFEVADGSTFEIFPNSKVIFRNNPPTWKDLLDVFLGKVRVKIEHLINDKPNPNRVITPTAVISVRGTTFDITVDPQDENTLVEVEEGVVGVTHALLPTGNEAELLAGDSIRVYRDIPIAKNRIDKGGVFQQALRMALEAVVVAARPGGAAGGGGIGGGVGGGGGGPVGDTGSTPPPTTSPGSGGNVGGTSTGAPGAPTIPVPGGGTSIGGPIIAPPTF